MLHELGFVMDTPHTFRPRARMTGFREVTKPQRRCRSRYPRHETPFLEIRKDHTILINERRSALAARYEIIHERCRLLVLRWTLSRN